MASKKVIVNLDVEGSVEGSSFIKTGGTSSQFLLANGTVATNVNRIIGTDTDISYSGATVLNTLVLTDGVVTGHSSRTLTLANLGFTGATNANYYIHPTYNGDDMSLDTGALSGAVVVSDIDLNVTTDTLGHVTDANATYATRTLTLGNLGYTGATDANKYIHPNYSATNINTSGATIVDIISTNGTGHVTSLGTRTLTLADLGYTGNTGGGVASIIPSATDGKEGIEITNGSSATVTVGLDLDLIDSNILNLTDVIGVDNVGKNIKTEKSQFFAYSEQLIHQITGNASTTTFAVWHDLGFDAHIQIYDWNSGSSWYKEQVFPKVEHTSASNVQVTFNTAPATGQNYRVLMSKINSRNV
tara:strand:- start:1596 stop:2672 length:1077 start_codon:yes stop_codon:yes gene_type:complete